MSDPAVTTSTPEPATEGQAPTVEDLIRTFNEVRTQLVSTLYYMLGNYEDAQDAAQEAFVKCWRNHEKLSEVRNLRLWIFRVGLNAAKDLQRNAWYRRARPLTSAPGNTASRTVSPVQAVLDAETRERLRDALLQLRPEEKEVYLLRENGSLTYEEIAQMLQCPVGTVKTQMRAAVRKLKEALQEQ